MQFIVTMILSVGIVTSAHAKVYLNCVTEDGVHRIRMGVENEKIFYEYSKGDHVELRIDKGVNEVIATPWPGTGRAIWNSLRISNEGYDYEIFANVDRIYPEDPNDEIDTNLTSGVWVYKSQTNVELVTINCADYEFEPDPEFTYELMREFGLCYNGTGWIKNDSKDCWH